MRLTFAFPVATRVLGTLLPLLMSCGFFAQPILHAQSMASAPRPDELDTADRHGGQVGGIRMGINYRLVTLRCGSAQVMVGANIRRGDVLNFVQVTCATPSCANGSCTWSAPRRGMSAGNASIGEAHPAMMCRSNEIVSGIRGRVLVFAGRANSDFAADIEIECSQMISAAVTGPSGQQFYPVSFSRGSPASWHHPDGGFSSASPGGSREVIENYITGPISCGSGGYGATAISLGVSSFLQGEPAVQAVSLYCPRIAPAAPQRRAPDIASGVQRKQKSNNSPNAPQQPAQDIWATAGENHNPGVSSTATQQLSQPTASGGMALNVFRLMTPQDPMWANKDYAGTVGYFAGKSPAHSNCHGFVGEMGVATPGANLCGNEFMRNLPRLPAGTPHHLGDVAIVAESSPKVPWRSAIFLGCNLYLQRNGGSDIQIIGQGYLDSIASNQQVYYVRPTGMGTFTAKLAALKATISPVEGATGDEQSKIGQIRGCFPN